MMEQIPLLLLRTTVCTALSACIAMLLLKKLQVHSPMIHRLVFVLVLLQGWAFFPMALELPIRQSIPDATVIDVISSTGHSLVADNSLDALPAMPIVSNPKYSITTHVFWIGVLWAGGAAIASLFYLKQYASVVYKIPLGRIPTKEQWATEWSNIACESGVASRTQFRVTDDMGPLLCFVPFFYLILAPERLWSLLDRKQRESILRHELAHVTRCDLWKSIGIRLLALPQWFNPFAWKAVRAFDEAAEWACDDLVMRTHGRAYATAYPAALLRIAESTFKPLPGSVAAQGGVFSTRIQRLVEGW